MMLISISKKQKYFFVLFLLLIASLLYRHYSYVYSLSPMVRDFYQGISAMPKKGPDIKDASEVARQYFSIGMTKAQTEEILKDAGMRLGSNVHMNPSEKEKYDDRVTGSIELRGGFAGWWSIFLASYELRAILYFKDGRVADINAIVAESYL